MNIQRASALCRIARKMSLKVRGVMLFLLLLVPAASFGQLPVPDGLNPDANGKAVTIAPAQAMSNLAVIDSDFNPGLFGAGTPLAIQADGKMLFASPTLPASNYLTRFNLDGSRDVGFLVSVNGNTSFDPVRSAALQADGKIVLGGSFTNLNGLTRNRFARLNPNGTLDNSFNLGASGWIERPIVPMVAALAEQADGRIIAGGKFTNFAGLTRTNLVRLSFNGIPDSGLGTVEPSSFPALAVTCLAFQSDGKLLIGGAFNSAAGQVRRNLARFNSDGTLDGAFDSSVGTNTVSFRGLAEIMALAVQADDKIIIAGTFTNVGSRIRNHIARLHSDGTLDDSFDPGVRDPIGPYVRTLAIGADGKIIVGGRFTSAGGQGRTNLARLNADGTLDRHFTPAASSDVNTVLLQADGNVLVAGSFTSLAGQPRNGIGRLLNPDPATQSLTYDGSSITWLRGGSSPEVWRTTFEHSTDGTNWINLGAGSRIPGGWRLNGVSIPLGGTIRARGHLNGNGGKSSWFVETLTRPPPRILASDAGFGVVSNRFGFAMLGWPGHPLVVEGSSDLMNWTPLQTNMAGAAPVSFFETNWLQAPQRFFRARTQ